MTHKEEPSQTPENELVTQAFLSSRLEVVNFLQSVHHLKEEDNVATWFNHMLTTQVLPRLGTTCYDEDMRGVGYERPLAIEIPALSPFIKVALHPVRIFRIREGDEWNGIVHEGPQTLIYFLDGFEEEVDNLPNLAASYLFAAHISEALLDGAYPVEKEQDSDEFRQVIREGVSLVRRYARGLDEDSQAQLNPVIKRIGQLEEDALDEYITDFIFHNVEEIKPSGLVTPKLLAREQLTPAEALSRGKSYLNCDVRILPQRPLGEDVPLPPWVEYGTNRWDRDLKLYGRYELLEKEVMLQVDYILDSEFMPTSHYGFFSVLEITVDTPEVTQHVVLGVDAEDQFNPSSVSPILLAGEFDFSQQEVRGHLESLVKDSGTKKEVAAVLGDVLHLSDRGLLRVFEE